MGITLAAMGQLANAHAAYDEAIRRVPNFGDAWFNKGMLLDKEGDLDAAVQCYKKALGVITHSHGAVLNNLGVALNKQGKLEEAVRAFTLAVQVNPDNARHADNLKIAQERLRQQQRPH
jgi:tetratricopeptide (TPR) repeat protein